MKKQGFTLVELMVAITILGLLTAVGLPKLTGAIDKAKASELAPAASSYTKLQSAYLYEHKAIGTWKKIGYKAPGGRDGETDVFKYSKGDVKKNIKAANIATTLAGDGMVTWQAENKVKLSGCDAGNVWKIRIASISDHEIEYRPYIEKSNTSQDCTPLNGDWGNFQTQVSMNTPPTGYSEENSPSSSNSESVPSVEPASSSNMVVAAGGSTTKSSASVASSSSVYSSSSVNSSSSETKTAFYDEEEDFSDEDDGSCGEMYTKAGNRCPPSWCKLNGNVSRNHGGWNSKKHKWYECYVARQGLIQEAANDGLVTCKNKNVCKVNTTGTTLTIKGNKISTASEEISDEDYAAADPYADFGATYNAKGRDNAEYYLKGDVICVEGKNDSACKVWRRASECELIGKDNYCSSWMEE